MSTTQPKPTTRRQRVEEKEQAILTAARAVFIELGFEGARMAEIARRAGMAEGTVYLYYKTKKALMQAMVNQFWEEITAGAHTAVKAQQDTFAQLRALALYHIGAIIDQWEFMELTVFLRGATDELTYLNQMRTYVGVFDEIFKRGLDRGDLVTDTPTWVARDVFSGSLDYSARTLILHNSDEVEPVVDNLMAMFRATYAPRDHEPEDTTSLTPLVERLEAAVSRAEGLGANYQVFR